MASTTRIRCVHSRYLTISIIAVVYALLEVADDAHCFSLDRLMYRYCAWAAVLFSKSRGLRLSVKNSFQKRNDPPPPHFPTFLHPDPPSLFLPLDPQIMIRALLSLLLPAAITYSNVRCYGGRPWDEYGEAPNVLWRRARRRSSRTCGDSCCAGYQRSCCERFCFRTSVVIGVSAW